MVGLGDREAFIASAIPAFLAHTRRVVVLDDGDVVVVSADGVAVTDRDGVTVEREEGEVTWDADAAEKGGYETFMIKEIHEQPQALADTLAGRLSDDGEVDLSEVDLPVDLLRRLRRILIIGCGTSYHAGLIASYAMETFTGLPVQVDLASEFRYRQPVLGDDVLVIAITQSGETTDTLAAMRLCREAGVPVLALTNIMGSQATRDADAVLFTRAGLEIGVAATKTHVAQVAGLLLLTLHLAAVRGTMSQDELLQVGRELRDVPDLVAECLVMNPQVEEIARRYAGEAFFLYLGRHIGYGVCLEGALKLKEIAYIPTESYAAGEMKHGPIALLDKGSPVVVVANDCAGVRRRSSRTSKRSAPATPTSSRWRPTATTPSSEIADATLWIPRCDAIVAADGGDRAAAAPGLPHRLPARPQRRPAAQPRQDGDGGVKKWTCRPA